MELSSARDLLTLAESVSEHILGDGAAAWTARLDEKAADLGDAVETLIAAGDDQAALRLVGALSRYAQASGRMEEIQQLVRHVVRTAGARRPDGSAFARAALVEGELAFRQGNQAVAASATQAALAAAADAGDVATMAQAEMNLARIAFRDADAPRIFSHAQRILVLAGDDLLLRAGAIHMLGWAEYTSGNLKGAIARFEENVDLYGTIGDRVGMAGELANLGDLALDAGDVDRAAELLLRALDLSVATASRYLLPSMLGSIAMLCGLRGRAEEMLELSGATDEQYRSAGLQPDPGGDASAAVLAQAIAAVGEERADQLRARGRGLTLDDALDLARTALAS